MRDFFIFLMTCLMGTCSPQGGTHAPAGDHVVEGALEDPWARGSRFIPDQTDQKTFSGEFLAAHFAQSMNDWKTAARFMDRALLYTPDNLEMMSRAMVLAVGSGDTARAVSLADSILKQDKASSLALLFKAVDAFSAGNYEESDKIIAVIPAGTLSDFIKPLFMAWSDAARGEYDPYGLSRNTIHLYHAVLIADFLGKKEFIAPVLEKSLGAQGLTFQDLQRIADVYAHTGKTDIALQIYRPVAKDWPENEILARKIDALEKGTPYQFVEKLEKPQDGLALALLDMARLLSQEQSEESARVFANLALMAHPGMTDAKILLAFLAERSGQFEEALALYRGIPETDYNYTEARYQASQLLERTGRTPEAISELEQLYRQGGDIRALIRTGDIYRRAKEFDKAVKLYNQAAGKAGDPLPAKYWELLYVRGMAYERLGNWEKAEKDLKAALAFQPDHPHVLNYLGYAWADQGVNLEMSLDLIRKAASLEPEDGYIIDSLGWVLYRMGRYEEAIPHLEKSAELLPYDAVINDHLGDAYWQGGRRLEARFQWTRAKNSADASEEPGLIGRLTAKLENGLEAPTPIKEARTDHPADTTDKQQNN